MMGYVSNYLEGNILREPPSITPVFFLDGITAPIIHLENFVKNYTMRPLDVTAGLWSVTQWDLNWAINKGTLKVL